MDKSFSFAIYSSSSQTFRLLTNKITTAETHDPTAG